VADALSRMYEEDEDVTVTFMALIQPLVRLVKDLKSMVEQKMLMGLSALFYWKGMHKPVEDFIKQCLVCQQNKYSTQAPDGLLQSLLTPATIWEDVSMDFIVGLRVSKGLMVILMAMDQFSKCAHFGTLRTSFNAHKVVKVFMEIVVKYQGSPKTIVSGHYPIFISTFWKQLFESIGTQLNHSTTYHP
nr:Ty3/gypsy retrotransposon protein [Tanacetum cinerariifolium]